MGLRIDSLYNEGDYPRETQLLLKCDGEHPFFVHVETFVHPDGFIGQYKLAMRKGWKETRKNGVRMFFCPSCSGKIKSND